MTSYLYNALGERAQKTRAGVTTNYLYDNNKLIGEYDSTGNYTEYIYLGKLLIAVNKNGNIYHVHNDHLNTPRKITSSTGAVVFDWSTDDPFGGNTPSVNTIGFNVRYPGQYYDSETGWHYNMNRYYNPKSGKYTQPDPIGLGGGLNMYNYVQGNSLNYYDESGLEKIDLIPYDDVDVKRSVPGVKVPETTLGIVSHGSNYTVNGMQPILLASFIQNTNYDKLRKSQNLPSFIDLMACQTASVGQGRNYSIAQEVSKRLYDANERKRDFYVLAPTGNIINIWTEQIEMVNFNQGSINLLGSYKVFKNGEEIGSYILKPENLFYNLNKDYEKKNN